MVFEAALRFLEVRPRSVGEVRRRLTRAGYRSELVEQAIARLIDLGILDDEAFARAWVESRDRAWPRGERALRAELFRKGVPSETIAATLETRRETPDLEAGDATVDESAAARLLARHARTLQRIPDPRQRRQRAYALLARAGFDPDTSARLASAATAATLGVASQAAAASAHEPPADEER